MDTQRQHDSRADSRQELEGSSRREEPAEAQLEERAAQERTAISAQVVYEAIVAEGEAELRRPTSALAFSGLAAGLSMGFSFLGEGLLRSRLPETPWRPLVAKLGYSVGFLIVILGRQQLFTENTLTPILPLLKHPRREALLNTLRLWAVVLFANWVGTMAIAAVLAHSEVVNAEVKTQLEQIAQPALSHGFGTTILKGVFAGWLIALLVWVLPYAETGRVTVIILMTYLISLGSFSHVVAGSVDTFFLLTVGKTGWAQYLGSFMLPTLVGNILGGVSLVAFLNHAQVAAGKDDL